MGSEGKIISAGLLAEKIASYGYAALVLYYCKGKGLSNNLSEIPLGSVPAFMSGVVFNDISCVIGVSPTCIIPEGFINRKKVTGESFLIYQGKEFPFVPLENNIPIFRRFRNVYF